MLFSKFFFTFFNILAKDIYYDFYTHIHEIRTGSEKVINSINLSLNNNCKIRQCNDYNQICNQPKAVNKNVNFTSKETLGDKIFRGISYGFAAAELILSCGLGALFIASELIQGIKPPSIESISTWEGYHKTLSNPHYGNFIGGVLLIAAGLFTAINIIKTTRQDARNNK